MIISGTTDSFHAELLREIHNFGSDIFKMALYSDVADLGPTVAAYTADNEVSGAGYVAGGATLSNCTIYTASGVSYVDFDDPTWVDPNFQARAGLIYNSSKSNRSVLVLDFGMNRTFSPAFNSVQLPAPTPSTALIRIGRLR